MWNALLVQEVVTHFQWRYLPDLGRSLCGISDGPAEKHPGRQFGRAPRQQKWWIGGATLKPSVETHGTPALLFGGNSAEEQNFIEKIACKNHIVFGVHAGFDYQHSCWN